LSDSKLARAAAYVTPESVRDALIDMVNIQTPTGRESELAKYIVSRLAHAGLDAYLQEVSPGRFNGVGVRRGSGEGLNLLLTGHMDTSYDGDEEYLKGDGFKPKAVYKDGWIWGLGAYNMKGGLAAAIIALEALARADIELKGDVSLGAVVGEIEKAAIEEFRGEAFAGYGTGSRYLVLHGVTGDFAILAEPTGLKIGVANLGCVWAKISTRGTMAHSAMSNAPGVTNAIAEARAIQEAIEAWNRDYGPAHEFMGERPNITLAAVRGGLPWRLSRNPFECNLYVDIRTVPGQTADSIKRDLRRILRQVSEQSGAPEAAFTLYLNDPATSMDPNELVVASLHRAHRQVFDSDTTAIIRRPAADSTHFNRYDVPCAVYGPGGRLHPDAKGHMHAAGEHIHVDDLLGAAKTYLAVAIDLCNKVK